MGIVGLQLCGKTGGVCQNKVGRSSQFRFKTGAVPAPVGFAYDVVAPVIDANRRMEERISGAEDSIENIGTIIKENEK